MVEMPSEVTCIVVHGRGQTPADMQRMIVSHFDVPGVRFVLPKSDGAGWYAARAIDPLTEVTRAELATGLDMLAGRVALAKGPVVLAGFSQGACLCAEYLLRHGPVAGACLFTGCRVGTAEDDLPLAPLGAMPIYATGGDADPWIPATAFHRLLADLTTAGARVRSDLFPGRPHAVTRTELKALARMLDRVLLGTAVFKGDADVFA
jgi:phospholipase/carboxylesterase